jgi:hypothetical protein
MDFFIPTSSYQAFLQSWDKYEFHGAILEAFSNRTPQEQKGITSNNNRNNNVRSVRCNQNILCQLLQKMLISVLIDMCRNYLALTPSTREQNIAGVHT